jgi:hypothetical protein
VAKPAVCFQPERGAADDDIGRLADDVVVIMVPLPLRALAEAPRWLTTQARLMRMTAFQGNPPTAVDACGSQSKISVPNFSNS